MLRLPERDAASPKSLRIPPESLDLGFVSKISPKGTSRFHRAWTRDDSSGRDGSRNDDEMSRDGNDNKRRTLLCTRIRDPRVVDIIGIYIPPDLPDDHDAEGGGVPDENPLEVSFDMNGVSKTAHSKDIALDFLHHKLLSPWTRDLGFDRCGSASAIMVCSKLVDAVRHSMGVLGEADATSSGMVGRGLSAVIGRFSAIEEIAMAFSAQAWSSAGICKALAFEDVSLSASAAWEGGRDWDRYCWADMVVKDAMAFAIHFANSATATRAIADEMNRRWLGGDVSAYLAMVSFEPDATGDPKRAWCDFGTGDPVVMGSSLHCMIENSTEGSVIRNADGCRPRIAFLVDASVAMFRSMIPCARCSGAVACQHIILPVFRGKTIATASDLAATRWVSARTEFHKNAGTACHAMGGCGWAKYSRISTGSRSSESEQKSAAHDALVALEIKRISALSPWKRSSVMDGSGSLATVALDRVSKRMKRSRAAEVALHGWSGGAMCIGMADSIREDAEDRRLRDRLSDCWWPLSLIYSVAPWKGGSQRDGALLMDAGEGAWRSNRVPGLPGYAELRESGWDIEAIAKYCPPCITKIITICKTERHPAYRERMHIGCLLVAIDGLADDQSDGLYKTWKRGLFSHPESAAIPDASSQRFDRSKYGKGTVKRIKIFTMEKGKRFGCNSAIEDLICPFAEAARKEAESSARRGNDEPHPPPLPMPMTPARPEPLHQHSEDDSRTMKMICARMCSKQLSEETGRDFSGIRIAYPADFYARKYAAISSQSKQKPKSQS
jgi:hypothetical protein